MLRGRTQSEQVRRKKEAGVRSKEKIIARVGGSLEVWKEGKHGIKREEKNMRYKKRECKGVRLGWES